MPIADAARRVQHPIDSMRRTLARKAILIVDDHPGSAEAVVRFLAREGYPTLAAPDGRSALEAFRLGGVGLVLMDVDLPRLDGFAAAGAMRAIDPAVPIVLMSADHSGERRRRALAAGACSYWAKPLDPRRLREQVARLIGVSTDSGSSRTRSADQR